MIFYLFFCLFSVTAILFFYVLDGWVLSTLWEWFVVPLGLPSIGIPHAVGLLAIASLMLSRKASRKAEYDTKERQLIELCVTSVIHTAILFLMGAIAAHFMP